MFDGLLKVGNLLDAKDKYLESYKDLELSLTVEDISIKVGFDIKLVKYKDGINVSFDNIRFKKKIKCMSCLKEKVVDMYMNKTVVDYVYTHKFPDEKIYDDYIIDIKNQTIDLKPPMKFILQIMISDFFICDECQKRINKKHNKKGVTKTFNNLKNIIKLK